MSKKTNHAPAPAPAPVNKIMIVVICDKCGLVSSPFEALEDDLAGDRFAPSIKTSYGACNCSSHWRYGTVLREPFSLATRIIILQQEVRRLRDNEKLLKAQVAAYERAMTLLGGRQKPDEGDWRLTPHGIRPY